MSFLNGDKPKDECGVFGIYGPQLDVATLTYYGLYALQHRGQESAGIAVSDGEKITIDKNLGLVAEVFDDASLAKLQGKIAIGHVRYSTAGESTVINAQPLTFRYLQGAIALAHNGNLTNANELRQSLALNGSVFQSTSDTEVIINLIARYGQDSIEDTLLKCMIDIKGAYSLVLMTEDKLIGVRDPLGIRPLCLGKIDKNYVLSSETCALDTIGAEFVRDIEPGEIIIIDKKGIKSLKTFTEKNKALCVFEFIYLARPDSIIDGQLVLEVRKELGRQLARESKIDADIVVPVPDSGTLAAVGFAEESGIPLVEGLMKNRYIGRTFIQPSQKLRDIGVRLKINPIKQLIAGKRVVLVDDSIVRGTTSKKIINMVRKCGVKEIHLLITSPPIKYSCYYGIDTSAREELIANRYNLEELAKEIGVDSLTYLSLEGLIKSSSLKIEAEDFCTACFDGSYRIEIPKNQGKFALERGRNNG